MPWRFAAENHERVYTRKRGRPKKEMGSEYHRRYANTYIEWRTSCVWWNGLPMICQGSKVPTGTCYWMIVRQASYSVSNHYRANQMKSSSKFICVVHFTILPTFSILKLHPALFIDLNERVMLQGAKETIHVHHILCISILTLWKAASLIWLAILFNTVLVWYDIFVYRGLGYLGLACMNKIPGNECSIFWNIFY
jgi:hypothetical protein